MRAKPSNHTFHERYVLPSVRSVLSRRLQSVHLTLQRSRDKDSFREDQPDRLEARCLGFALRAAGGARLLEEGGSARLVEAVLLGCLVITAQARRGGPFRRPGKMVSAELLGFSGRPIRLHPGFSRSVWPGAGTCNRSGPLQTSEAADGAHGAGLVVLGITGDGKGLLDPTVPAASP